MSEGKCGRFDDAFTTMLRDCLNRLPQQPTQLYCREFSSSVLDEDSSDRARNNEIVDDDSRRTYIRPMLTLSLCLSRHQIPVELCHIIFHDYLCVQPLTNTSIREAVYEWCGGETARYLAQCRYGHIRDWDTSKITDMRRLFANRVKFNDNISHWDVSAVTNMADMFSQALAFNQSLATWNVRSVYTMAGMFYGCFTFNQPLHAWHTSSLTNMHAMFLDAKAFNQPLDGVGWDLSNVTKMGYVFSNASRFNQSLANWNVRNVTFMTGMFKGAIAFNQPLNTWNVSKVTCMSEMFQSAKSFNQPLDSWSHNLTAVTDMDSMFEDAIVFNQPLNTWNVQHIRRLCRMFQSAKRFNYKVNLDGWQYHPQCDKEFMFYDCGIDID